MPKSIVTDSNASHFGLLQREMTFFGRWGGAREEILTGSDWERRGSDLSVTRLPRPKPCHMAYFIPNRQNEHHADVKWEVGSFISESSGVAPCWPLERMQFLRHFCTGFTFRPESSPPPPPHFIVSDLKSRTHCFKNHFKFWVASPTQTWGLVNVHVFFRGRLWNVKRLLPKSV